MEKLSNKIGNLCSIVTATHGVVQSVAETLGRPANTVYRHLIEFAGAVRMHERRWAWRQRDERGISKRRIGAAGWRDVRRPITADDTGQLNALLTQDEEARRFYNNYMFLHAELYSQHASLEAVESEGDCGSRIADCGLRETGRL